MEPYDQGPDPLRSLREAQRHAGRAAKHLRWAQWGLGLVAVGALLRLAALILQAKGR